jgi:hypothetical protein
MGLQPTICRYAANETIYTEGSPGRFACLVRKGEVEIFQMRDGVKIAIGTAKVGQMFGELEMLDGAARMAAVRAVDEVEVEMIDRAIFVNEFQQFDRKTQDSLLKILNFVRVVVPFDPAHPAGAAGFEDEVAEMATFLRGVAFARNLETSRNSFSRTLTDLLLYYATRRVPPA